MKYRLKITDELSYITAWDNFTIYHDPLWLNSKYYRRISEEDDDYITDQSWEDYCNSVLKGIGKLHWVKPTFKNIFIDFYTEEDMVNFIMKWS